MALHEARYRYRLRVNVIQAALLNDVFDACRYVWNRSLGDWTDLWKTEGIKLGYGAADKALTARRSELEWLAAQPSVPEQQVVKDLYRSISAFFDKSNPAGRPKFKKRRDCYATARWTKNGFRVAGSGLGRPGDRLSVAVSGRRILLRVVWSRPLPSTPTSVTISRDRCGHHWVSFVVRVDVPEANETRAGQATGLDVGLNVFATTEHPATDIENPRFARAMAKALARSQRNTARKQNGSKNRSKAKKRHASLAARVANQRADFHHKSARGLVDSYARIGIENLSVKNMARKAKGGHKRGLNRSVADAGWSQFRRLLQWQATKAGTVVVVLPAKNTTQKCSCCGAIAKPRIELSDRIFACRACGLVLERDRNAARNLNPDRVGTPVGGSEPTGAAAPVGDDGRKPRVPAGILAA
jgi:putative transposase